MATLEHSLGKHIQNGNITTQDISVVRFLWIKNVSAISWRKFLILLTAFIGYVHIKENVEILAECSHGIEIIQIKANIIISIGLAMLATVIG